jgi:hypothetical protein
MEEEMQTDFWWGNIKRRLGEDLGMNGGYYDGFSRHRLAWCVFNSG